MATSSHARLRVPRAAQLYRYSLVGMKTDVSTAGRCFLGRMRHREAKELVALDGIDLEFRKGEAFGIVGRNGAGKSTLLRVMARTLRPDECSINVYGKTSTLLQLGAGSSFELSGRRNVYLAGLAAGLRKKGIDARFDKIVEYAELWDLIDRPARTYSSGMLSRLTFSVGVAMEPNILLLDETLAVGDEAFRTKSMKTMRNMIDRQGRLPSYLNRSPASPISVTARPGSTMGRSGRSAPAEDLIEIYEDWL